jgi:Protein of unknown function (DUF1436).
LNEKLKKTTVKTQWANVKLNKEFLCIQTYSGYGSSRADHRGVMHILPPDASGQAIGEALLDALSQSRFVLPEPRKDVWIHPEATFDSDLYNLDAMMQRYKDWVAKLMAQYGYKTKRALFKDMKSCTVESKLGTIEMTPSHHEKLEAWSGDGFTEADNVVITADSAPDQVGFALRLALSRCT